MFIVVLIAVVLVVFGVVIPILIGPLPTAIVFGGIAVLRGVIPKRMKVASLDGRFSLESVLFDFRMLPMALIPVGFSFLHNCHSIGHFLIWLGSFLVGGAVLFLATLLYAIYGVRFCRLRDHEKQAALARFVLITGWDETGFDALWLDDNRTLLLAFPTEVDWTLFRCDVLDVVLRRRVTGVRPAQPYRWIFGNLPPLKWVRYRDDYPWLEELYEKCGIDPEEPRPCLESGANPSEPYTKEVRNFFARVLPTALSFPNIQLDSLRYVEKSNSPQDIYSGILRAIPKGSQFYRDALHRARDGLLTLQPDVDLEALDEKPDGDIHQHPNPAHYWRQVARP